MMILGFVSERNRLSPSAKGAVLQGIRSPMSPFVRASSSELLVQQARFASSEDSEWLY